MRLALVALAIAWLAVTGWAFEAGRRAEAEYRASIEALDQGGPFAIAVTRYDRGLFASEVTTVLGPTALAEGQASATRLVLHQRIAHGPYPWAWVFSEAFDGAPILARAEARPTLEIEGSDMIEEIPLPLRVEALFTRRGGARFRLAPDPDAAALDDPELSGDWQAIHAELAFAYDGSTISASIEVPRIVFEGEGTSFRVEGLTSALDFERADAPGVIFTGTSRFHLGRFAVGGPGGALALRDLDLGHASQIVRGSWSAQLNGSLGGVEGGPAGGASPVGGGELALRATGIALAPLSDFLSVGGTLEAEGPGSDAAKAELWIAAAALWPALMAPGPEIEVSRLRVETPEGELRMTFRAGVDASDPAVLSDPLASLPALELDLELSLPQTLLERWLAAPRPVTPAGGEPPPWVMPAELASRRVETWLERGHLGELDGSYVASVRMRKGAVRMNGRVVAFDAL